MTLFRQQFRAQFIGLLVWLGAGLLLAIGLSRTAPAAINGGMETFQRLPEQFQRLLGLQSELSALDNYVSGKIAASIVLLVVLYAVVLGLSVVTREVDRRTVDFLLALPVSRGQILLARMAVLALNTGLLSAILWAAVIGDLKGQGLEGGALAFYWLLGLAEWLLALMVGSLTLLISLWIDDYSLAIKLFMGVISASYFLELVLKAAGVTRWGRLLSPFSYADPVEILVAGRLPLVDTLTLLLVTGAALTASLVVFERKQITG